MEQLYDHHAPKKATNLTVNSDLLKKAKMLHINLSQAFEFSLIEILREKQLQIWQAENQTAIEDYNQRIAQHGLFSDSVREF